MKFLSFAVVIAAFTVGSVKISLSDSEPTKLRSLNPGESSAATIVIKNAAMQKPSVATLPGARLVWVAELIPGPKVLNSLQLNQAERARLNQELSARRNFLSKIVNGLESGLETGMPFED